MKKWYVSWEYAEQYDEAGDTIIWHEGDVVLDAPSLLSACFAGMSFCTMNDVENEPIIALRNFAVREFRELSFTK